ncbi:TMEM175 family protein [Marinicella sediminis]|nr:TMEM175 family protein [Marinicella sediminis]
MIREHLFHRSPTADPDFRWRGGEVSRVEAFSDGIFAITVTLLIVSTASIERFYDVWILVRDLPAFLLSFAFLMYAWFEHHRFFRRYGLQDGLTLLINTMFLFLIMILAYPLKLLTTFLWYLILGIPSNQLFSTPPDVVLNITEFMQRTYMMYFYSAAVVGVFGCLLFMHLNALWKKQQLELDELELVMTQKSYFHHLATVTIAVISMLVLWLTKLPGWSGVVYFMMPLAHFLTGLYFEFKMNRIKATATEPQNNQ